jgi:hypothetical protein
VSCSIRAGWLIVAPQCNITGMARKSKKKPNIKVTTLSSVDKRLTQKPFIKKPKVDKESKAQVKKAKKNGGVALDKNLDKLNL